MTHALQRDWDLLESVVSLLEACFGMINIALMNNRQGRYEVYLRREQHSLGTEHVIAGMKVHLLAFTAALPVRGRKLQDCKPYSR